MSKAQLDHHGPWSEEEFLALDDTATRIELIDGGLWVSPAPSKGHQYISSRLWLEILHSAEAVGLEVLEAVNVRLVKDRIVVPDIVVSRAEPIGDTDDVHDVVLVGEIVSRSNALADRAMKKELYAAAGIDWYLLVEPDLRNYASVTLQLLRRDGSRYIDHASAGFGEDLSIDQPFPMTIRTTRLVHRSRA